MSNDRVSHRSYVSYIDKSRHYYEAHGYGHPYRWAHYSEVPFQRLRKPLSECRVGMVTTSALVRDKDDPRPMGARKRAFAAAAHPAPSAMFTMDLSWDKDATHTDDMGSYLPLDHLSSLADQGIIGSVSPRFYGVPTDYSQRRTREVDAPEIVDWCQEDELDVVILVPL